MNMADIREIQRMDHGRVSGRVSGGLVGIACVKKEMIGVLLKKMESI